MFIELNHRHSGIHTPIKYLEISCEFSDIFLGNDNINEDLLLKNIPEGWLPEPPNRILLAVGDKYGATGQGGLHKFRSWAKYFDAYCLDLRKEPSVWYENQTE